tara:strand:+ start:327 stop:1268 length:942 start_codon:yes stop_codon:yes gene_type:complete
MSGGKGGSQTSQVEIPSWIQQPSMRNMARAEDVQQIGYQPYMGPDVAGFTEPQQQAMQSNIDAASAFGLVDPGMNAMDGMPQATDYNGMSGYSSFPLYEQAVNDMNAANPEQAAAYGSLFGNETGFQGFPGVNPGIGPGAPGGPSGYPGGNPGSNLGGGSTYTPPGHTYGPDYPGGMPGDHQLASGPDMSNYFTMDQVNDLFANQQGPDLSGYATNESVSNQFDNFNPTGPAPYDDSGIMDLIRGNQSAIQNAPSYDDSQLRSDIDSRFNSFEANAGVKPAPRDLYDDSGPVINQGLDMFSPKMLQNSNRRKF